MFSSAPRVCSVQEEDILDLLEQCELDDEKLMGKSSRQRGPKVRGRARDSEAERERGGEKGANRKGPVASRDPREKCRGGCQRGRGGRGE